MVVSLITYIYNFMICKDKINIPSNYMYFYFFIYLGKISTFSTIITQYNLVYIYM